MSSLHRLGFALCCCLCKKKSVDCEPFPKGRLLSQLYTKWNQCPAVAFLTICYCECLLYVQCTSLSWINSSHRSPSAQWPAMAYMSLLMNDTADSPSFWSHRLNLHHIHKLCIFFSRKMTWTYLLPSCMISVHPRWTKRIVEYPLFPHPLHKYM